MVPKPDVPPLENTFTDLVASLVVVLVTLPKAGVVFENKEPAAVVVVLANGEPNKEFVVAVVIAFVAKAEVVVVVPPNAEPKEGTDVTGAPKTGAATAAVPNTEVADVVVAPKIEADEEVVVIALKAGGVEPKTLVADVTVVFAKIEGAVVLLIVLNAKNEEVVVTAVVVAAVLDDAPKTGTEDTDVNVDGVLKMFVDLVTSKLVVLIVAAEVALKLNDAGVDVGAAAAVTVLLTEGNKFLEMPLDDAPVPNAKDLFGELLVTVVPILVVVVDDLVKLKPPLVKLEELVVVRLPAKRVDCAVVTELFDVELTVVVTIVALAPERSAVELDGVEVNDNLVGNLKFIAIFLGESSFFIGGIEKALLLGILKALTDVVVVVTGEETFGIAVDEEEVKSNLKPPTFGVDIDGEEVTAVELVVVVVAGESFPNENVGVVITEGTVVVVILLVKGREEVTGDEIALVVVVLLVLKEKSSVDVVTGSLSLFSLVFNVAVVVTVSDDTTNPSAVVA